MSRLFLLALVIPVLSVSFGAISQPTEYQQTPFVGRSSAATVAIPVRVINFPPAMRLVGFTAATIDGGKGVFTHTQMCQLEFGPDTRFCTLEEAWTTVDIPPLSPDVRAWVGDGCIGWSQSSGSGPTLLSSGAAEARACSVARPVSCCGPVDE